jgi:carboxyl-terminal processing protease
VKSERWNRILSHALVALVSVTATVAVMLGVFISKQQNGSKLLVLEQLILDRFIGEADQTVMEDAAAHAMVGALGDRWSYYIPADEYAAYMEQMNNAYVGVGITITPDENGGLRVITVTEGGPAAEAGMLVEDVIVAVDGQSILGMEINESKKLIQGEENTTVTITVLRNGEERAMTVTRRAVRTPVARGQLLEENIGLVTIYNFNSNFGAL